MSADVPKVVHAFWGGPQDAAYLPEPPPPPPQPQGKGGTKEAVGSQEVGGLSVLKQL